MKRAFRISIGDPIKKNFHGNVNGVFEKVNQAVRDGFYIIEQLERMYNATITWEESWDVKQGDEDNSFLLLKGFIKERPTEFFYMKLFITEVADVTPYVSPRLPQQGLSDEQITLASEFGLMFEAYLSSNLGFLPTDDPDYGEHLDQFEKEVLNRNLLKLSMQKDEAWIHELFSSFAPHANPLTVDVMREIIEEKLGVTVDRESEQNR